MPPRRKSTQTSAFGAPGRSNHDASAFYNSRLYDGLPDGKELPGGEAPTYCERPIPPEVLNTILCHSSQAMSELPDCSVHLMVTSPPYNVGKEYDQNLTLNEYLSFLESVWKEVHRVLVPGGRACINIANLGRKPYIPLHAHIIQQMSALGYWMRGEILWNKAASASPSTAWGSWQSPANPTLRDIHEYILVFSKDTFSRQNPEKRPATITKEEFLEYTKSVWNFPAEPARKIGHPAPFPVELPRRLIALYTFAGEVVLDPFMGSGQTALAAMRSGRNFVGYDVDEGYVKLARERVKSG